MSYYVGIDGGGTKTNCVLCDESLDILYQTLSGPSNFLTIGTDKVSDTIIELIKELALEENLMQKNFKLLLLKKQNQLN